MLCPGRQFREATDLPDADFIGEGEKAAELLVPIAESVEKLFDRRKNVPACSSS